MEKIKFTDENASFQIDDKGFYKTSYFPVASEKGLKSVVTPTLNGDVKLDQNSFLMYHYLTGAASWYVCEKYPELSK